MTAASDCYANVKNGESIEVDRTRQRLCGKTRISPSAWRESVPRGPRPYVIRLITQRLISQPQNNARRHYYCLSIIFCLSTPFRVNSSPEYRPRLDMELPQARDEASLISNYRRRSLGRINPVLHWSDDHEVEYKTAQYYGDPICRHMADPSKRPWLPADNALTVQKRPEFKKVTVSTWNRRLEKQRTNGEAVTIPSKHPSHWRTPPRLHGPGYSSSPHFHWSSPYTFVTYYTTDCEEGDEWNRSASRAYYASRNQLEDTGHNVQERDIFEYMKENKVPTPGERSACHSTSTAPVSRPPPCPTSAHIL